MQRQAPLTRDDIRLSMRHMLICMSTLAVAPKAKPHRRTAGSGGPLLALWTLDLSGLAQPYVGLATDEMRPIAPPATAITRMTPMTVAVGDDDKLSMAPGEVQ
eukprot:492804-Prymnesium_polylepis.1